MARPSLSESQIAANREHILEAALAVFDAAGASGVTIRAIATEARCSPALVYSYFGNKAEILSEIRAEGFVRLRRRFESATSGVASAPDRFRLVGEAYVRFAIEEPELYAEMFHVSQRRAGQSARLREERGRAFGFALDVAHELEGDGVSVRDPLALTHLFWTGLHGLVTLELADQLDRGRSFDELLPAFLELHTRAAGTIEIHEGALQ